MTQATSHKYIIIENRMNKRDETITERPPFGVVGSLKPGFAAARCRPQSRYEVAFSFHGIMTL